MPTPSLFDQNPPEEAVVRSHLRSGFAFLNRTTDSKYVPLRDMLDDWFSRYPEEASNDLSARFRSSNEIDHVGAFFELVIHQLHIELGAEVHTHFATGQTGPKIPDFFVTDPDLASSYVEATVVTGKSMERQAAEARMDDIVETLNRLIESPNFWLSMERRGLPRAPAGAKQVAQEINRNLAKLDQAEKAAPVSGGGSDSFPIWSFDLEGCVLTFQPFPKGDFARGKSSMRPIALQTGEFEFVDDRGPIRKAITRKANRYGSLGVPFVVALNCIEMIDEIDIMEALFGKEQFHVPVGLDNKVTSEDIGFSRKPDGAWTNPIGPRYSRVSAVLIAIHLRPWSIGDVVIRLYHNPWAELEYSSVLTRLNQARLQNGLMRKIEGDSLADILELNSYLD